MKTVTQIENAELSPELDTKAMGMVLNATSFNHIINSLYKNPLGAILRELTTNALESHMIAKTTRKVAIQLPVDLDQNLVIRDFGTGLDDDEVQRYLNTLFSTSKDKDNTLMGGFGLGSKSPLALVDTFNIVSIKNGLKNNYAWIKEPGKLPNLVYLDDEEDRNEPTDEDDGVKITIPLGSSTKISQGRLKKTVEDEASRQLLGFSPKIMLVDNIHTAKYQDLNDITSTVITEELVLDLPHISLYLKDKSKWYPSNLSRLILIGGVNYPFSEDYSSNITNLFKHFINTSDRFIVCLKAPIGVLELPMSREEILTTSHNEKVLQEVSQRASKDIQEHIKSLNIDINCSLADFYTQLKNAPTNQKGGVEFNLEVTEDIFKIKDKPLIDFYKRVYSSGTLQYTYIRGHRLPSRLLERFLETSYMTMSYYTSNGRNKFGSNSTVDWHTEPHSIYVTSSTLPSGISHAFLESYINNELKPQHPIAVIQVDPKHFQDVHLITDVLIAYQQSTSKDVSVYCGALDPAAIEQYRLDQKALMKQTNGGRATYTRATLDYIPGARLITTMNSHHLWVNGSGTLYMQDTDKKVTALEDRVGKRIQIGPDYIPVGKSVLLTSDFTLPVDMTAFMTTTLNQVNQPSGSNYNLYDSSEASNTCFKDCVILKVTTSSYAGALKRLQDAKITTYTQQNKLVATRPSFVDIPQKHLGANLIKVIKSYVVDHTGLYSRSYPLVSDAVHATMIDVLTKDKRIPHTIRDAGLEYLKTFVPTSIIFAPTLSAYQGYKQADMNLEGARLGRLVIESFCSDIDSSLGKNLYKLVNEGLNRDIFDKIIDNLITTSVKGKLNEIQTPSDQTT